MCLFSVSYMYACCGMLGGIGVESTDGIIKLLNGVLLKSRNLANGQGTLLWRCRMLAVG